MKKAILSGDKLMIESLRVLFLKKCQ